MSKLQQTPSPLNDSDRLREALARGEAAIVQLSPERARQLLACLDEAEALLRQLAASRADLRAERTRFEVLQQQTARHAAAVVRALGGGRSFANLRRQIARFPEAAWWQLDAQLRAQRRRKLVSALLALLVMGVLGGLVWQFRATLFPRDPVLEATFLAERALQNGELAQARAAIDDGLAEAPDAPLLLIWRGALSESEASAQHDFERARAALGDEAFYMQRAQVWLLLNRGEDVVRDADRAFAANPASAAALMLRASGYELMRDFARAARDLRQAEALADAQGDGALSAMARVRLALLVQAGLIAEPPTPP